MKKEYAHIVGELQANIAMISEIINTVHPGYSLTSDECRILKAGYNNIKNELYELEVILNKENGGDKNE